MADKAEFQGDVGQAVMGNVNEAPRLSNVVHVNLAGEQGKPKLITNLQRKSIATKVKELVQIGDLEPLDVYRVILNDFGVETIAELPRERYKDVMALLDGWITETKGDVDPTPQRRATDQIAPATSMSVACAACEKSLKVARDARMMTIMQIVVILAATAFLGWLMWSTPADVETSTSCYADGKKYSVGSNIKMVNSVLKECFVGVEGRAPYWGMPQKSSGR